MGKKKRYNFIPKNIRYFKFFKNKKNGRKSGRKEKFKI